MKNKKVLITVIILIALAMIAGIFAANGFSQSGGDSPDESENSAESTGNEAVFDLKKSKDVKIRKALNIPKSNSSASFSSFLSDYELINSENTEIFIGTVTNLENILISFEAQTEYRCILTINGISLTNETSEEAITVKILLPVPIAEGVHSSISSVAEEIEIGTKGIFIAKCYTEDSIYSTGDSVLYLNEVSDYGLDDGERYLIIENDGKLIFSESCYPSLKETDSLDDAIAYVKAVRK